MEKTGSNLNLFGIVHNHNADMMPNGVDNYRSNVRGPENAVFEGLRQDGATTWLVTKPFGSHHKQWTSFD